MDTQFRQVISSIRSLTGASSPRSNLSREWVLLEQPPTILPSCNRCDDTDGQTQAAKWMSCRSLVWLRVHPQDALIGRWNSGTMPWLLHHPSGRLSLGWLRTPSLCPVAIIHFHCFWRFLISWGSIRLTSRFEVSGLVVSVTCLTFKVIAYSIGGEFFLFFSARIAAISGCSR
jgi:hypothetical protein